MDSVETQNTGKQKKGTVNEEGAGRKTKQLIEHILGHKNALVKSLEKDTFFLY